MKNSKAIILNLKDEYSKCIVPDFTLGERGLGVQGQQRECAKTVERHRESKKCLYTEGKDNKNKRP